MHEMRDPENNQRDYGIVRDKVRDVGFPLFEVRDSGFKAKRGQDSGLKVCTRCRIPKLNIGITECFKSLLATGL